MEVKENYLYFIKDDFFEKYKSYNFILNKKDNGKKRPCFYAQKLDENLYIMIPISSKIEKYKIIRDDKLKKNKKCYNFVFGNVLGIEKVFLIQNMFLIKKCYIEKVYIDKFSNPISVEFKTKNEVEKYCKKSINLHKKLTEVGKKGVLFVDIFKLQRELINEEGV